MAREYWPCYYSYADTCKRLTDEELGRLFRALMIFGATGERTDLAGRECIAFDFIADDIERSHEAYERVCEKNRENGNKGGRPPKPNGYSENPKNRTVISETQKTQSKDKEEDKDKGKVKRFIPPTAEEVRAYCEARGNAVDPQRWMDYYTSNGWKVGKNPMKDWKAAVRTWEQSGYNNSPKREKDFADLWREMDD
jgi:hypothetical protein